VLVIVAPLVGLAISFAPAVFLAFLPKYVDLILREEIGHRLAVGSLDLDVWRLHLTVHDLMLAPAAGGPPVATCEVAEVEIDPARIFRGIYITQLELRNVSGRLVRRADGRIDVIETFRRARAKLEKKGEPEEPGPFFHVERLQATQVRLELFDEPAHLGNSLDLTVQALEIGNVRTGRPEEMEPGRFLVTARRGGFVRHLEVVGEADLAAAKPWTHLSVVLDGLDLPSIAAHAEGVNASARKLHLSSDARIELEELPSGLAWTRLEIGPTFVHADEQSCIAFEGARLAFESVPGRAFSLPLVEVARPELAIELRPGGSYVVCGLEVLPAPVPPAPPPPPSEGIAAATSSTADYLLAHLTRALERGEPPSPLAWELEGRAGAVRRFPRVPPGRIVVTEGTFRARDRATEGAPDLRAEDITCDISVEQEHEDAPERASGRIRFGVTGLARAVDLEVEAMLRPRIVTAWVGIDARGLEGRALEPYLAPSGKGVRLAKGQLRGRASAQLEQGAGVLLGRVTIADFSLEDEGRALARLDTLETRFVVASGERSRIHLSKVALEGGSISAKRTRAGEVDVAGFMLSPPVAKRLRGAKAPAHEPSFELGAPRISLSRVSVLFDDESAPSPFHAAAEIDASLSGFSVGAPGVATLRLRARAPGIASDLEVEGRAFTSAVTPALVADVRARGLESDLTRSYLESLGWDVQLEGGALRGRAGIAFEPAAAGGQAFVLRVTDLALDDDFGRALGAERLEVRVARIDPAVLVTEVPLVELTAPFVFLEQTARGLRIARAFTRVPQGPTKEGRAAVLEPASPGEETPAPRPPVRDGAVVALDLARIDRGELELIEKEGRRTRVEGIRLRAGPIEFGPGESGHRLEFVLGAAIAGLASDVQLAGSITRPYDTPRIHVQLRVAGLDLEGVRARVPDAFSSATVHSGTLRADLGARLRFLRSGIAGEASLRDVALLDEGGRALFSLAEARVRISRIVPETLEVDVASVDVDRPHVTVDRAPTGEIVAFGLASNTKFPAFSDAERVERIERSKKEAAPSPDEGRTVAPRPTPPPAEAPAVSAEPPRISSGRITLAGGSVVFTDAAALDEKGRPLRLAIPHVELNIERLDLGSEGGVVPTTRFFIALGLDDGGKISTEGTIEHETGGLGGWVAMNARDIQLARFSRYSENADDVRIDGGTLSLSATADLAGDRIAGKARLVFHKLRVRRLTEDRVAGTGSFVGVGAGLAVITDAAGDTTVTVPFEGVLSNPRVSSGRVVSQVFSTALLNSLQQPVKLVVVPIEKATGQSPVKWVQEQFQGKPPLEVPRTFEASFAPGDARLTLGASGAVESAARLAAGTRGLVSVRSLCGPGDRIRAARQGAVSNAAARALLVRVLAERRAVEAERRDVLASERAALEAGDETRAESARARLAAIDERLERLGRSMDDLANRVEATEPEFSRTRAEDALRRLAEERAAAIRRALIVQGIDADRVRILLPHLDAEGDPGRVTIEVAP
jgi:hypothetical protein